ncbi:LPD1 domain-containing protein (plasmid) [Stutzerimonas frequens]|uniref:LPD1 domain-containing protein n=1 Tax=Stutzerimonas frequens TaxID=2968969 RepID=UPI002DB568F7|nr:LPD1 domain-containing protein [Stutzerimonas frequens]WRW29282.1 LPD1 domain-containing protein [Stutzerimonas frequens]
MDRMPSVWGQHDEALIDAMMIRGKLITSIIDAPVEWRERLSSLGFRQTNTGWLKLGQLTPAEYAFLSPDIDLIGFRTEGVHEAVEIEPDRVPLDVKDTLLGMWQKQRTMVMVALSMEHEKNHTRAEAWSFIEAALEGERTPETDTLYGLAFTKMHRSQNLMSPAASQFADELGWKKPGPKQTPQKAEKLLFAKGETIEWMDADGVLQSGRLARRMSVTDIGGWVYQSPRWVGGYSLATPKWVDRSRLYFNGSAQDWLNEQLLDAYRAEPATETESKHSLTAIGQESALDATSEQIELLKMFMRYGEVFPPSTGVDSAFSSMREHQSVVGGSIARLFTDENLEWLLQLDGLLKDASTRLYGNSPIMLAVANAPFEVNNELVLSPALMVTVRIGTTTHRSRSSDFLSGSMLIRDGHIAVGEAANEVEHRRYSAEKVLRTSSATLAKLCGSQASAVMLASDFHGSSPMFWPKVSEFYDGQLTVDDIIRIQSVVMHGSANVVMRVQGTNLADAFEAALFTAPRTGMALGEVVVSVKEIDAALVDLVVIRDHLSTDQMLSADWINDVPTSQGRLFEAAVRYPEKADFDFPPNISARKGSFYRSGDTRALVNTPEEAISHYLALLDRLEPLAEVASQDKIVQLKKMASNFPLFQRLVAVPAKLEAMAPEDLRQRVKAQLYMQEAKRIGQLTNDGQLRLITQITQALTLKSSQGAVCLFSSTGRSIKWRVREVKVSSAALDQTRKATLESEMLKLKNSTRSRGVSLLVDGVAIADPELAEILNGEGPAQLKSVSDKPKEGYQDTGVVAGWAMKDIRGMKRVDLLDAASRMSDEQKVMYLTRELLWPRKSFEEMKEAGADLQTAFCYDLLWKSMPKSPLTATREHVAGYIDLITSMKEALEPLMTLPFLTQDEKPCFVREAKSATSSTWTDILAEPTRQMYRSSTAVRGFGRGLRWNGFAANDSNRLRDALGKLSWSDVLKSKKAKATSSGGSRVARGEIVRKGPNYREGKSVTGEDFIRTFGFSGVEYGNWTSQAEREKHLNLAYDSMMDFVRIMGWEPMTLSLGGKLGLCIGSRGRGGTRSANAHFEPVNQAINLTRMRGDGALAHEYFHAVAYHYGILATGSTVDVTNTFGYVLQEKGPVPPVSKTGLRDAMQSAFHNLVVAIMRRPQEGADYRDINQYTQLSSMLLSSMGEDGVAGDYWGSPQEMFARSMEIWFKDRLSDAGEQNDYLVRADKAAGSSAIYPDPDHIQRINYFVTPWLEAIEQEVSSVDHPFLGNVEMPILNTEMRSIMPLTPAALADLASTELDRLFHACAPNLMLINDPVYRAGLYDLGRDLIILNANSADRSTFYHEAWHACHSKLLTDEERYGLSKVFDPQGELASQVERLLTEQGASRDVLDHMRSDAQEVQAYAFQLWQEGLFTFDDPAAQKGECFYKVGNFVDGVTGIGDMFGPADAQRLFTRFISGDLAARNKAGEAHVASPRSELQPETWEGRNVLYWGGEVIAAAAKQPKAGFTVPGMH